MKSIKLYPVTIVMIVVCIAAVAVPALIMSQKNTVSGQVADRSNLKLNNDNGKDDDKTLSPYFYVNGGDKNTESLPLKATSADVNIAGVIADVKVTQEYMNTGTTPIEAIYVFPASTRAAVYSMKMRIGDRILIAKIKEKEQARADYDLAKQQGKSATLLEQERPNVFQMNVANIMPGDTIKVELCYTELLIPEEGVYEFVYPTVVGPRYSNKPEATASTDDKWVSNPYTHEGEKPTYTFDFYATISAGIPIKQVSCPSHDLVINYTNPSTAGLTFKNKGTFEGNRDVIVQYKLTDNKIESGLLLYKGTSPEENFFLTMIQPPPRPSNDQIPAREYIFIMDVSGSMGGFPIETSKKLMKNLISNIRTTDKFNVMLFAGSASVLSEQSMFATEANLNKALSWVDEQSGGGGTELLPALKQALAIEKAKGFSRTFVIATDGYVDIEKESFDLIRDNLGKANFFAFGIGSSVNRYLVEGIACAGMGESFVVTDESQCDAQAERFRKYVQSPVLTDVKIDFGGFDVYDVEPANIPDVLAERPVIIFGKWKGDPKGTIKVTGTTGSTDFNWTVDVSSVEPQQKHAALKYLWAREKIRMIDDMGGESDAKAKDDVTKLGLKYNLLTNYTSFIAIDSLIRNAGGKQTSVTQPLPLPQGVSDYAVGGYANGATGYNSPTMGCKRSSYSAEVEDLSVEPVNNQATQIAASYIGGEAAMKKFIKDNMIYPMNAQTAGIKGTVKVEFTLDANGDITNVKVLKGLGYGCDEEAIRLVGLMKGLWNVATLNGAAVSSTFTIDIKF
jgi:Ca-activated chloride channel homolog